MNKVIIMGRLTRDPEVRYTQGPEQMAIARFTLAIDRRGAREGAQNADFPACTAFGKTAEFAEKYLRKGMKILITGRLQTGSYKNREGVKVYTTDVICEGIEFAESKSAQEGNQAAQQPEYVQRSAQQTEPAQRQSVSAQQYRQQSLQLEPDADGFVNIPDGIEEELPFA